MMTCIVHTGTMCEMLSRRTAAMTMCEANAATAPRSATRAPETRIQMQEMTQPTVRRFSGAHYEGLQMTILHFATSSPDLTPQTFLSSPYTKPFLSLWSFKMPL